jgi:diketogulonate reductase-like aldo/keto reductase
MASEALETTPETRMLPLMGLGTFIGIEGEDRIDSREERMTEVTQTVLNALKIGYRHIDLATGYDNLSAIGAALKLALAPITDGGLGIPREELWLTLKSDNYSSAAIDACLDTLGVDYVDTFMLHHPYGYAFSSEMTLCRILRDVSTLPKDKVRTYGISNCYLPQVERIIEVCKKNGFTLPFSNEIESNIFAPNLDVIEFCKRHKIQVIAYSPIGYAYAPILLSEPDAFGVDNTLLTLAAGVGSTAAQASLAWHMSKGVAVIPKSRKKHRLEENFNATTFIPSVLEQSELAENVASMSGILDAVTETARHAKQSAYQINWPVKSLNVSTVTASVTGSEVTAVLDATVEDSHEAGSGCRI